MTDTWEPADDDVIVTDPEEGETEFGLYCIDPDGLTGVVELREHDAGTDLMSGVTITFDELDDVVVELCTTKYGSEVAAAVADCLPIHE